MSTLNDLEVMVPVYGPHGALTKAERDVLKQQQLRTAGGLGSGNFGHVGRPGAVGGSGRGESHGLTSTPAQQRLTQVMHDADWHWGTVAQPQAFVADDPVSIRAAAVVADVMEEMHAKGYTMPGSVSVGLTERAVADSVAGTTSFLRKQADKFDSGTYTTMMNIDLPEHLPVDANLDDAVRVAFGGQIEGHDRFVPRTMREFVVHEMGHVQWGPGHSKFSDVATQGFSPGRQNTAMESVSTYAATDEHEFIAEAFTRLYRGETLTPDAAELYKALNGPVIR